MFNEATVVGGVVRDLVVTFGQVICVDDGSADNSAAIAQAAGAIVVRHPINLGMGAAIQTGLSFGLRDPAIRHFVTFDADGQHRVDDAIRMVDAARDEGVDVVLGSRFLSEESLDEITMPRSRRILLRVAVWFTRLTSGLPLTDAHNGLRVFNRNAAASLQITLCGMAHASEILGQIASKQLTWSEQPVTVDYTDYSRSKGQGNINAINISWELIGRRLRAPI
jgi:glycosyltransferase involved in cell wall biosynthesis